MAKKKIEAVPDHPIWADPVEVLEVLETLDEQEFVDYGTKQLGADQVWSTYTGKGVKVAVLDTGIDWIHQDLTPNRVAAQSFVPNESPDDSKSGHGTHCSGIIAACNNGIGVIGAAPNASLYIGKVLCNDGYGEYDWIQNGMRWAIDQGVHIISMSIGCSGECDPGLAKLFQEAYDKNIHVFVAAGNSGHPEDGTDTLSAFAKLPTTIAIAASDKDRMAAVFSSQGKDVDYIAPGYQVYSCYPRNSYARLSGTSMATPYMAGITALYFEKLFSEGKPLPPVKETLAFYNTIAEDLGTPGFDVQYGYGMVHIEKIAPQVGPEPEKKYYRVQLGAFSIKDNAIKLRDELNSKNVAAICKFIDPYWKVQVGAYSMIENARKAQAVLEEMGYETFITYY